MKLWFKLSAVTSFYKLIRSGADVDCWSEGPDGCSQTLLHRAIDENKDTIAKFLVRSVEFSDVYTGDVVVHDVAVACDGVRTGPNVVKILSC